jgi:hypothetical protein
MQPEHRRAAQALPTRIETQLMKSENKNGGIACIILEAFCKTLT